MAQFLFSLNICHIANICAENEEQVLFLNMSTDQKMILKPAFNFPIFH